MPRGYGFDVMDVSTSIADDPKFRRLSRTHPDVLSTAFMAYVSTMAESWKVGQRVPVDDAWPILLPFDEAVVGALKGAGLLDKRGLIPLSTWESWYAKAERRRENARERYRRFNEKRDEKPERSPETRSDNRVGPTPVQRGSDVVTVRAPTVPSVPSVPSVRTKYPSQVTKPSTDAPRSSDLSEGPRLTEAQFTAWSSYEAKEWAPFKAAWLGRGFLYPPQGAAGDDDDSVRGMLWQIADARPLSLGQWVREAKGKPHDVIQHVLSKWHAVRDEVEPDEDVPVSVIRANGLDYEPGKP